MKTIVDIFLEIKNQFPENYAVSDEKENRLTRNLMSSLISLQMR
jgi:hypothetical protein